MVVLYKLGYAAAQQSQLGFIIITVSMKCASRTGPQVTTRMTGMR